MSPLGSGINIAATVSNSLGSVNSVQFTFNAPVVTHNDVKNGPTSGGSSITITGSQFGAANWSPTASTGVHTCLSLSWASSSTLFCEVAPTNLGGEGRMLNVIVGGVYGTVTQAFTFNAPVVTYLNQANLPVLGAGSITVTGSNFGGVNVSPTSKVYSNAVTSKWVSSSSVTAGLDWGVNIQSAAVAGVSGVFGTLTKAFTFDGPKFTYALSSNGPSTGGLSLTLQGLNLGAIDRSPSASITVICATTAWTTPTQIVCKSPAGGNQQRSFLIEVDSVVGSSTMSYTFDAPVMTHVIGPYNAPASSSASITIGGSGFVDTNSSPTMNIGVTICQTSTWTSSSAVTCGTQSGFGKGKVVNLVVQSLFGTQNQAFSYNAPVATYIVVSNAPTSGGMTLTVNGVNFGVEDTTPVGVMPPNYCMTTKWITDSTVYCQSAAGSGSDQAFVGSVSSMFGTFTKAFSYDSPTVTDIIGGNSAVTGSSQISILGDGFGSTDLGADLVASFGSTGCSATTWVSDSSLVCTTSAGRSSALKAVVSADSLVGTHTVSLSYNAPIATSVSSFNAPTSGSASVTVGGTNFGVGDDYTPSIRLDTTFCTTGAWLSNTAVVCQTPVGRAASNNVGVSLAGVHGTGVQLFSYDGPVLTAHVIANAPTSGLSSVTVRGSNFASSDVSPTIYLGVSICATTAWISPTSASCSSPVGHGLWHTTSIEHSGMPATITAMFSFDAPVITHETDAVNAPPTGGASLSLVGLGFGAVSASPTVMVATQTCVTSRWVSDTAANCLTLGSVNVGSAATNVVAAALMATLTKRFTFDAPAVTALADVNGPSSSGASVTIDGVAFGRIDPSPTGTIGSTYCATSLWLSASTIVCKASPNSMGRMLRGVAEVNRLVGTVTQVYTYNAPVVTYQSIANNPLTGANSVTVTGSNFQTADSSSTLTLGVTIGMTTKWISNSAVVAKVAAGYGVMHALTVEADLLVGTSTQAFSYSSPIVSHVNKANAPTSGVGTLTVSGANFGHVNQSPTGHVSGTICLTSQWVTDSSMLCTSVGSGTQRHLAAIAHTLTGTLTRAFTFDSPVVTHLEQSNSPSTTGASLTVSGMALANADVSPTVQMGRTVCMTSRWISASSATCLAASGTGGMLSATLAVDGILGTGTKVFTYDAPAVTYALNDNAPTSGRLSLTLNGIAFGVVNASPTSRTQATVAMTTQWLSASAVVALLAPGGGSVPLHVITTAAIGTMTMFFTYNSPTVTVIDTVNGPATGGGTLTVTGVSFGSSDLSPTIRVGGKIASSTMWVSETKIVAFHDVATTTIDNRVEVYTRGLSGTKTKAFTFNSPFITYSMQANSPITVSSSITLRGSNFGSSDLSTTAKIGTYICSTTQWVSSSSVSCASPGLHSGLTHSAVAALSTLFGTTTRVFSYDAPVVTHANAANAPTSGSGSVTLGGHNFGALDVSPTVVLGSTICMTTNWVTASAVVCSSPAGEGRYHHVLATVAANAGSEIWAFTMNSPVITVTTQFNTPTSGGTSLTVNGMNLGVLNESPTAKVGDVVCSTSSWVSSTAAVCRSYNGRAAMHRSLLEVSRLVGTTTMAITFDVPVLSHLATFNGAASGGTEVSIEGLNFGDQSDSTTNGDLGGTVASATVWVSQSLLTSTIVAGMGKDVHSAVHVSSLLGTKTASMTYNAPVVTSFSGAAVNAPTTGSASLTLSGNHLGASDGSPTAAVAAAKCTTSLWLSSSSVSCEAPQGREKMRTASVEVSTLVGTSTKSFSYDAAIVTAALTYNAPASKGGSLTLSGSNFGATNDSPTGTLGNTICMTAAWLSSTAVQCESPAGDGSTISVGVTSTSNSDAGTFYGPFTFDAPIVTASEDANAPTSGGSSVTVSGVNFGATDRTPDLLVDGTELATTAWISGSSIVALATSNQGVAHTVSARVYGVVGTHTQVLTFDAPSITTAQPFNSPTSGWGMVTFSGTNFAVWNKSPSAAVGGMLFATVSWISATSLSAVAPTGTLTNHRVTATVSTLTSTTTVAFSYNAPLVSYSKSANAPTSGGSSVTVLGSSFGSANSSPTVRLGSSICSSTSWISVSSVSCASIIGSSKMLTATTALSSVLGTGTQVFTFDAPTVSHASVSNAATSGGGSVTLSGTNFMSADSSPTAAVKFLASVVCTTSQWVSPSSVTCAPPSGTGAFRSVTATVIGLEDSLDYVFNFDMPVVTLTTTYNVPTTSGTSVTVSGTNFGASNMSPTGSIGSSICATSSWFSASSVSCLSASTCHSSDVGVKATLRYGALSSAISFDAPVVSSLSTFNGLTQGTGSVTINGESFGSVATSPTASVGSAQCLTSSWVSATAAVCQAGSGSGVNHATTVTVAAVHGTSTKSFSYNAPVITSISPPNRPGDDGGHNLFLLGNSFGASDLSPTISLGGSICKTTVWISVSYTKCLTPVGRGKDRTLVYEVGTVVGTTTTIFTYNAPVASYITTANTPATGGSTLTVHGSALGVTDSSPTARSGTTICGTSTWVSRSSLSCLTAGGIHHSTTRMSVEVAGASGTALPLFSFDSPAVSLVTSNGPASGMNSLSVSGSNFGLVSSSPTAVVGASMCLTSQWVSTSLVTCLTRAGAGFMRTVTVEAVSLVSTATSAFTFDAPTLSSLSEMNLPTTGGITLTVSGDNFGASNLSPTSSVAGMACMTSRWISSSSLTCFAPYGKLPASAALVHLSSRIGTMTAVLTYDAPYVTYPGAVNTPTTGGSSVTLQGDNFGATNHSPTASLDTVACTTNSWVTATSMTCYSPSSKGGQRSTHVALAIFGTSSMVFSYNAPAITSSPANAPSSSGASVTLGGTSFGSMNSSPTVSLDALKCTTNSWVSASSVVCFSLAEKSWPTVTTEVSALVGTASAIITFDAPAITSLVGILANSPLTGGATLTVVGNAFGATDISPTVHTGGVICSTSAWVTVSSVLCGSPEVDSYAMRALTVGVDTIVGTMRASLTFDSPVITSTIGRNSPTSGGMSVTVEGSNFGKLGDASPTGSFAAAVCGTTQWISDSSVNCFSNGGSNLGIDFAVTARSLIGTAIDTFSFDSPTITFLAQANSPAHYGGFFGDTLTVTGENFGRSNMSPTVAMGSTMCTCSTWVSGTSLKCRPSSGNSAALRATVLVASSLGTMTKAFSYNAPVITTLVSGTNLPTSGGVLVTMFGNSFGVQSASPTVSIGNAVCSTSAWVANTKIVCKVSATKGTALHANVLVSGLEGTLTRAFSYDAPVVSSGAGAANGPTTGGGSLTINGLNYASTDSSPTGTIDSVRCSTSTWLSSTAVTCSPPVDRGVRALGVVVGGVFGTARNAFTFDSPAITTTPAGSNVPSTGSSITMSGSNFAGTDVSPTMHYGATLCGTTQWFSSSSIRCGVAVGTQNVRAAVIVDLIVGTALAAITFDAPFSTELTAVNSPSSGGPVTISGQNFGAADSSLTAAIGGLVCSSTKWVTSSSIVCTSPLSRAGHSHRVTVATATVVGTSTLAFTYNAPCVTSLSPPMETKAGGVPVTMSATNLGSWNSSPTARIGSTVCASSRWVSGTSAVCTLPAGSSIDLRAVVTVLGVGGTSTKAFTFSAPAVTAVSRGNFPSSGGGTVTMAGTSFGAVDISGTGFVGSTRCATTSWVSQSALKCLSPAGYGSSLPTSVMANTVQDPLASSSMYDLPVVTYANAANTPLTGGSSLTFSGLGFGGGESSSPTASVGSTICATTQWITASSITCKVAAGSGAGLALIPAVGGNTVSAANMFQYDGPKMTAISNYNSPTSGSTTLTIMGFNMASTDMTPLANVGNTQCTTSKWISSSATVCQTPPGGGLAPPISLRVTSGGTLNTLTKVFSYDAPTISSVSPSSGRGGGLTILRLFGNNLGPTASDATITVGGYACSPVRVEQRHHILQCLTSAGTGSSTDALVSIGGYLGTMTQAFTYDIEVSISSIRPMEGAAAGGTLVEVTGINFGVDASVITVKIGGKVCTDTRLVDLTGTKLTCRTPAGVGRNRPVTVALSTTPAIADGLLFHYRAPEIISLTPSVNQFVKNSVVTLTGQHFGATDSTPTILLIAHNTTKCTSSAWVSDTSALCTFAGPIDGLKTIKVTVGLQSDTEPVSAPSVSITSGGISTLTPAVPEPSYETCTAYSYKKCILCVEELCQGWQLLPAGNNALLGGQTFAHCTLLGHKVCSFQN